MTATSDRVDLLAVLGAAVLWGTTGTAATFAPAGSSGLALGAAVMGFGGLFLFGADRRGSLSLLAMSDSRPLLLSGGAFVVAFALTFYSAMATAGVAMGVTLAIGTAPIFAALYEWLFARRGLPASSILGVAIAIGGACLLGWSQLDLGGRNATEVIVGSALGLTAGVCWAGYSLAGAALVRAGADSTAVVGSVFGLGAVVLLPIALLCGSTLFESTGGLAVVAYLSLVPMFCGYLLFGLGLRTVGAGLATALCLLEVAVAAILAALVAGEGLPALSWCGIALVGAALVLLVVRPRP